MKLSFACTLATILTVTASLAIVALSVRVYDDLSATESCQLAGQPVSTDARAEINKPGSERTHDHQADRVELPRFQPKPKLARVQRTQPENPPVRTTTPTEDVTDRPGKIEQVSLVSATDGDNPDNVAHRLEDAHLVSEDFLETVQHQPRGPSAIESSPIVFSNQLPTINSSDNDASANEYFDLAPSGNLSQKNDDPQNDLREEETRQNEQWLRSLRSNDAKTAANVPIEITQDAPEVDARSFEGPSELSNETSLGAPAPAEEIAVSTGSATPETQLPSLDQDEVVSDAKSDNEISAETKNTTSDVAVLKKEPTSIKTSSEIQDIQVNNQSSGVSDLASVPARTDAVIEATELPKDKSPSQVAPSTVEPASPKATTESTQPVKKSVASPTSKKETSSSKSRSAQKRSSESEIVGWPLPETLFGELDHLEQFEMTGAWAKAARNAFQRLNEMELTDPQSAAWLEHCRKLANQLNEFSDGLSQSNPAYRDSSVYMTQVAYHMTRRIDIWLQVHRVAAQNVAEKPGFTGRVIAEQIANRSREIQFESIDPTWQEYLMLEQAQEIFSDPDANALKYRAIAQKILSRATSGSLTSEQVTYAQNVIGNDLGEVLRGVASGQVNLGQFLIDLERHETKPSSGSRARLNSHFQNYYWSRDKDIQGIANRIDDHYRNANLRLEFSQQLINSMIPNQAMTYNEPVSDRILGAAVRGQSRVTNQISVELVPDPQHLSFRLHSNGRILSRTLAHAQGFTFSNLGNGLINASKVIAIGENGVSTTPTNVRASSQDRLLGVEGQMDGVPLLGGIARKLAVQQKQAQGFQAKQIIESKMRSEFRTRIDQEIYTRVDNARQWFQTNVLNPLHAMELEPSVVQLQTTNEAAIVRYRLASLDQNAADTPRPHSQPGSVASFQMHRSAANNIINRIHINGKEFTPQQFMDHLNMLLGRTDLAVPPEQNKDDVTFRFASSDAIQLNFQDGKLEIMLRIRKLQIGKRLRWKNLVVNARYSPVAAGQNIQLTFDEDFGLRVRGDRLKFGDQLTVRTIFSSLFKPDFQFDLLPAEIANHQAAQNLNVSELVLSNGWLGVSFNQSITQPATESLSRSTRPPQDHRYQAQQQNQFNARAQSRPSQPRNRAVDTSRFYRPQAGHRYYQWR